MDFNNSLMGFIPKGVEEVDGPSVSRRAEKTRPLKLINTCAKILAFMLHIPFAEVAKRCVHLAQTGFVKGRCTLDNLLSLEAFLMASTSIAFPANGRYIYRLCCCLPFSRACLQMACPLQNADPYVRVEGSEVALQRQQMWHIAWRLGAARLFHYMLNQARLSTEWRHFCNPPRPLCKDARCLSASSSGLYKSHGGRLGGCSGRLSCHFHAGALHIHADWAMRWSPPQPWRRCSCVQNLKKWMRKHAPIAKKFSIEACARFLGYCFGPSKMDRSWITATVAYLQRTKLIRGLKLGLPRTVFLYISVAFSKLSYISQLVLLPKEMLSLESSATQRQHHGSPCRLICCTV